jgi:hypothetical protein
MKRTSGQQLIDIINEDFELNPSLFGQCRCGNVMSNQRYKAKLNTTHQKCQWPKTKDNALPPTKKARDAKSVEMKQANRTAFFRYVEIVFETIQSMLGQLRATNDGEG